MRDSSKEQKTDKEANNMIKPTRPPSLYDELKKEKTNQDLPPLPLASLRVL